MFVSEEMKGDRELCTAAVAQDWQALEFASEEMKGDRELCTAAVAKNAYALRYASEAIKINEEIVVTAVRTHLTKYPEDKGNLQELERYGLRYAAAEMKQNRRVREAAGI